MPRKPRGLESRRAALSFRITHRMMFHLNMLERINHESRGEILVRTLEALNLGALGLQDYSAAGSASEVRLDDIWDTSPAVRLHKLATKAPGLMTSEEKQFIEKLKAFDKYWSVPGAGDVCPPQRSAEHLLVNVLQDDWKELGGPDLACAVYGRSPYKRPPLPADARTPSVPQEAVLAGIQVVIARLLGQQEEPAH